jgi:hypothetical protein
MRPTLHRSSSLGGNALVAGVQGGVTTIPVDHNASFLLCATRGKGINAAVQRWGDVLRSKFAQPKLAPTVVETKLGYWTDVRLFVLARLLPPSPHTVCQCEVEGSSSRGKKR